MVMSKSLLLKLMPKQNLSAPLGVKIIQNRNAWYNLTQSDLTLSLLLSILVTAFFGFTLMRSSEEFIPDNSVSRIMLPQPLVTSCNKTLRNKLYWMPLSTVLASPSFLPIHRVSFPEPSNMMGSRGFAWNCGGLRRGAAATHSKVMYFEKNFKNSFDFFFFLETHHKDEHEIPNELMRYEDTHHIRHSETNGQETHSGIIGLIRKEY